VLVIRVGECSGGVTFGFHRCQSSPGELLRLQVLFRASDGGLGGIKIRRCRGRCAGRPRSRDGLPSVAHFLHGSADASGKPDNTDKYSHEAQHRVRGH